MSNHDQRYMEQRYHPILQHHYKQNLLLDLDMLCLIVEDTLDPDTYLGLGVKILSWPFSFFKEGIPSFAKNDSKIKIMISLVSITKGYENSIS
mgnify:CR=1 FL=1